MVTSSKDPLITVKEHKVLLQTIYSKRKNEKTSQTNTTVEEKKK